MTILARARSDIVKMHGYSSARKLQTKAKGLVYLDANECPFEPLVGSQNYSRYPLQQPEELVRALCELYDVSSRNLIIARGADEVIDILVRTFCVPFTDNIVVCPPTFAMYQHSAIIHGIETRKVPLTETFSIDFDGIVKASNSDTKLIFVCSPNNPTANLMDAEAVMRLCEKFSHTALVVVDETYIEFSDSQSFTSKIEDCHNLVILRTLSKSYAAAGLRCGVGIAFSEVIALLLKLLPPYPIPVPVVQAVCQILAPHNRERIIRKRNELLQIKAEYVRQIEEIDDVKAIIPSQANFILVRVHNRTDFISKCLNANIIVRDQSHQECLEDCVRISIGTRTEMDALINALKGIKPNQSENQRVSLITRSTNETRITAKINLDTSSPVSVDTGHPFLDHMLEQVARHGAFSLALECQGDLDVEAHHTIEDCGIVLGKALNDALGDKSGIGRYGSVELVTPMDEAQANIALDLGGRAFLAFKGNFPDAYVGNKNNPLPIDMIEHIFRSIADNLQCTLHISVTGQNTHHMVETCFKGLGRALRQATKIQGNDLPSTKGML